MTNGSGGRRTGSHAFALASRQRLRGPPLRLAMNLSAGQQCWGPAAPGPGAVLTPEAGRGPGRPGWTSDRPEDDDDVAYAEDGVDDISEDQCDCSCSCCGCGGGVGGSQGRTRNRTYPQQQGDVACCPCCACCACCSAGGLGAARCRWRRRRRRWRRRWCSDGGDAGGSGPSPGPVWWLWCVLVLWGRCLSTLAQLARRTPPPAPAPPPPASLSLLWISVALLLAAGPGRCGASSAGSVISPSTAGLNDSTEKVCQSVDIRNSVENFNKLTDCTVVEGFVHITLIDHAEAENYTNITFPKLREIHGYLLLYRVNGLRSLSTLFPNLAVIRGHELMVNYALIIYEMQNLNDIGLISLMSIVRGSVRIEKNPVLCYVDTIDWSYISHSGDEHFFKKNKPVNECPRKCREGCPKQSSLSVSKISGPKTTANLCWTDTHCQKTCPAKCEKSGCTETGECCDKQCLGGCTGKKMSDCIACKGYRFNNLCLGSCPGNMYTYLDRRCIYDFECLKMPAPKDLESEEETYPWRFHNGSCLLECPPGYSETNTTIKGSLPGIRCVPCNGTCEKECTATHIDNIAATQRLRGCTIIKNALEIQVRGGKNLVKELEENLQSIREIRGHLKIVRSFPLVSLNFLKNLRIIHGNALESSRYALVVLDNQNLQKLWDWSPNSTFTIGAGKVYFHFNPKLCWQEIEALRNKTGLGEFDEHEVSKTTNGDKVACDMDVLNVRVSRQTDVAALIEWDAFNTPDPRTLLGYVVYRIEAPNKNVTLYDGRDACGGDGWSVDDVSVPDSQDTSTSSNSSNSGGPPKVTHIFTNLQPYTQYAFYVRTYTFARGSQSVRGAQSKITYFRTAPAQPSPPKHLTSLSNSSSEIVIRWQPSFPPNGNVTKYIIQAAMEKDIPDRTNYCDDPLTERHTESSVDMIPKTTQAPPGEDKTAGGESCACSEKASPDSKKRDKETERENEVDFEDRLHNIIYIRRDSSHEKRRKRTLHELNEAEEREMEENELNFEDILKNEIHNPRSQSKHSLVNEDGRKKRTLVRHISDDAYYRYKRSVGENEPFPVNPEDTRAGVPTNYADFKENCSNGICYSLKREVSGENSFVLKNLYHYARYSIQVIACRELEEVDIVNPKPLNCSPAAIIQQRTQYKLSADLIERSWMEATNSTRIFKWEPPNEPNGIIVRYDIQIQPENSESGAPFLHCLPRSNTSFVVRNLPPGNYSIRVSATSLYGPGNFSEKSYFIIPEPSTSDTQTLVFVSVGLFLVLMLIGGVGYYARRVWCPPPVPPMKLITNINPDYHSATYVPDEWEVPRSSIQIIKELGQGSFGMVYEGVIRNCPRAGLTEQPCAIKTVNEHSNDRDRIEFLNEASVMKGFKTFHVVRLLGVVSQGQPTLVVMELMAQGDLKSYLRKHRPDESDDPDVQPPTLKRILRMAMEIADGMAYLAAKKFVHRDLAARNCMVAADMTVKIGDFGMTRDIYETEYYRKGSKGLMPVRWMAPESLKDGVFTSASDVWSYGVVLWEMATLASQPYQGLANEQVLRYVKGGGVMEAPENCPEQLYNLMRRCWQFKAVARPSFMQLVEMLLPDVEMDAEALPSFNGRSFYHSPEGAELLHAHGPAPGLAPGLAPLEEAEMDAMDDIEAVSPRTPLRCAVRDIEDFDVDGSDSDAEQPEQSGMPAPAPTSYAQYHKAYSSDSSRDSKASNGSSANANANANTANGYIHDHWHRHGNGATSHTSHPPHSSHHGPPPTLKTTEC